MEKSMDHKCKNVWCRRVKKFRIQKSAKQCVAGGTRNGAARLRFPQLAYGAPEHRVQIWCVFILDLSWSWPRMFLSARGAIISNPGPKSVIKNEKKRTQKIANEPWGKKLRGSSFLQRRPGASREPSQKAASRKLFKKLFFALKTHSGASRFRKTCGCTTIGSVVFKWSKHCNAAVLSLSGQIEFSIIPACFSNFLLHIFYGFEILDASSIFGAGGSNKCFCCRFQRVLSAFVIQYKNT